MRSALVISTIILAGCSVQSGPSLGAASTAPAPSPAPAQYAVSGTVDSNLGSVTTSSIVSGGRRTFTLVPSAGWLPSLTVTGTCPAGSWTSDLVYQTGSVTSACVAQFTSVASRTVTATGDGNQTISTPTRSVRSGSSAVIALTPNSGFVIPRTTGGTCGAGQWTSAGYEVTSVGADCTVTFTSAIRLNVTNGRAASGVLGQPDFETSSYGTTRSLMGGYYTNTVDVSTDGMIRAGDNENNRALGFSSPSAVMGPPASFVLGQADYVSNNIPVTSATSFRPAYVRSGSGKFGLVDKWSDRLLLYNTPPTTPSSAADVVVGAPDMTTAGSANCAADSISASAISLDTNKLVVADGSHHRVLIYNTIPTVNGASASLVLGQSGMSACGAGAVTASSLNYPSGAWTDGTRLIVSDRNSNRVLIWNSFPTTSGQAADLVLGQANFTSGNANRGGSVGAATLSSPAGVWSNGQQIFVADANNNRVLVWNTFPTANGQAADQVLGQPDLISDASSLTGAGMGSPTDVTAYGHFLLVADAYYQRILLYNLP